MDERIAAMLTVLPQWIAGVFGLLFGSFLNVCIYRSQHDLSIVNPPRSFCPMCKRELLLELHFIDGAIAVKL